MSNSQLPNLSLNLARVWEWQRRTVLSQQLNQRQHLCPSGLLKPNQEILDRAFAVISFVEFNVPGYRLIGHEEYTIYGNTSRAGGLVADMLPCSTRAASGQCRELDTSVGIPL